MRKPSRRVIKIFHRGERGNILLLSMVFMIIVSLMIIPVLTFSATGIKTGVTYDNKADALYAADAGIEDAVWKIKYDHLETTLTGYDPVDFVTEYNYTLPDESGINGKAVDITIQNLWVPKDIEAPDIETANDIIDNNSVVIAGGGIRSDSSYHISLAYTLEIGDNLTINSLGVWLPPGFTYNTGSSNLETSGKAYYSEPEVSDHLGGQAIVWTFSALSYTSFPDVSTNDDPMTTEITFDYTTTQDATPDAVSWVTYQGLASGPTYSWDTDVRVFNVTSRADGTTVKTYLAKTEIRKTGGCLNGDYYATGNTLMKNAYTDSGNIRDTWINTDSATTNSSSQTVDNLTADSVVEAAYLYWTGWIRDSFLDLCSSLGNWTTGSSNVWAVSSGQFRGQYTSGKTRYIYLSSNKDISNSSEVYISWNQSISSTTAVFSDTCSSTNLTNNWTNGGDWSYSGGYYQATHSGAETRRNLTLKTALNLSSYTTKGVSAAWDQGILLTSQSQTQVPTGDGDSSGTWTPTASPVWETVNETTAVDTDYVTGTTDSGGYCLFTFTPFSIPTESTISNLTLNIRGRDATNGTNNIYERIKVDGQYYDDSSSHNPSTSFATYSCSWTTNPATGSAWTVADINGTGTHPLQQIGVYSRDLNPDIRVSMVYAQVNYTVPASETDGLYYAFSGDGGSTWSDNYTAFLGNNPDASTTCTIPTAYLTSNFKMRFTVIGCSSTYVYVYIDNIVIRPLYSSSDGLTLAVSQDGGSSYTDLQTYHADDSEDVSTTSATASVALPSAYLNNASLTNFRMQFTLNGFSGTGEYYYLDNIKITAVQPDNFNNIYLKINGAQVYFDGDDPAKGSETIIADNTETIINAASGTKGYSFACFKKITDLVQAYSDGADWSDENPENRTNGYGDGVYTIGNVGASLGVDGQSDYGDQLAHAGWSLILVYTSPTTLGHQIYLYDRFCFAADDTDDNTMRGDMDFDANGLPGGDISGFIIPAQTKDADGNWEEDAAQITCFVGEGDEKIPGDFLALNAPAEYWDTNYNASLPESIPVYYKLWDQESTSEYNTTSERNNVWNGLSTGCTAEGIDIDTFTIKWSDGLITPGQTSAHLDIYTSGSANSNSNFSGGDNFNLVYVIFSFRSEVTTGGSLSYLIEN